MRIWKLTPLKATRHKGYVLIRAADEARAREIAANAFERVAEDTSPSEWAGFSWKDPNQVECRYDSDDLAGKEGIMSIN